jgi:hypothetical protein
VFSCVIGGMSESTRRGANIARVCHAHSRRAGRSAARQRNCGSSTLSMIQTVPFVVFTAVQSAFD